MNNFISDDMPEKGMGGRMLPFFQVTKLQRIFKKNEGIKVYSYSFMKEKVVNVWWFLLFSPNLHIFSCF